MERAILLVFVSETKICPCYDALKKKYITFYTSEKEEFLTKVKSEDIDAAVVCLTAKGGNINKIFKPSDLVTKLPVLLCSDKITHEHVNLATKYGVNKFITFDMNYNELNEIITESISMGRVKEYLKSLILNKVEYSSYSGKFIDIIIESFPNRLHEKDIARQLNISERYLQKMCMTCFNRGYNRLQRRLRVYIALRLMYNTSLDNNEISLHLNYSENSSMSRDFEKELNCSLNEARKLLEIYRPKDLIINSMYLSS